MEYDFSLSLYLSFFFFFFRHSLSVLCTAYSVRTRNGEVSKVPILPILSYLILIIFMTDERMDGRT